MVVMMVVKMADLKEKKMVAGLGAWKVVKWVDMLVDALVERMGLRTVVH